MAEPNMRPEAITQPPMLRRCFSWRLVTWVVVVASLVWLQSWASTPEYWPIRQVRIEGALHHTDRTALSSGLESEIAKGFFSLDTGAVVNLAQQQPWVRLARVSKVWPDVLVLAVEEQVAVARWNEADLLNEYGDRFTPSSVADQADLPQLNGPDGHEVEVLSAYAEVLPVLTRQGLHLQQLSKSGHGSWSARFENGLVVRLGQQSPVKPLVNTLAQLQQMGAERFEQIQVIDMRYASGVAIAWKKGFTPDWEQPDGKSVAWVLSRKRQG